ncbi:MAG: type II CRISPR RNA-guided endonuclease Cas9 [Fimbriimonadales bacterium]|nr:type II CRISPR RNA-guided endonuclease Cas9 [Fimbriimonadales bacterium]
MMKSTLGLDLGTNSIGWAWLDLDESGEGSIRACGVRVFASPVEDKTKTPKNVARRAARGQRKTIRRRRMRLDNLISTLVAAGLLPEDVVQREDLFSDHGRNPYLLRRDALTRRLEPHEIGRALYHLCRRRGFKSNRKTLLGELAADPEVLQLVQEDEEKQAAQAGARGVSAEEKEEGEMLASIRQLREEMGGRTLGQYLADELESGRGVRRIHTERAMYEEEFEAIWESQKRFHSSLLGDSLKVRIHSAIFDQRPLKIQKSSIGFCRFEPKRKRAMKALVVAEDFRILQDLTNIRLFDQVSQKERKLSNDELLHVFQMLQSQGSMTWSAFRKALKLPKAGALEINLEEGGKDKLIGNRTLISLRKILPNWDDLTLDQQRDLQTDLLTIPRRDSLYRRLRRHWRFDSRTAYELAILQLIPGTASLSAKAMQRLVDKMREGLDYHDACQALGYQRDDQRELELVERLPEPPDARNPVVNKALIEVRKVVNSIVREYGKPDLIRVEMARDMKLSRDQKEEIQKMNRKLKLLNEEAEEAIKQARPDIVNPSRDDKLKYRLWKECGGTCPYTGTTIGLNMLFSADVDVEHIIPYTLCLDDSFKNKTLCMAHENRLVKKNRTPVQAYGGTPKYEEILQRLRNMKDMPIGKRKRFEMDHVNFDEFASRQLNDTRYICRQVKDYLMQLVGRESVQVTKGEATGALRWNWGLNSVIGETDEKSRDDHRHHAIDAIVIALTSMSLLKKLSDVTAKGGSLTLKRNFDHQTIHVSEPWPSFRHDVEEHIRRLVVSHAPTRKLSGALHEDTAYGLIRHPKTGEQVFAYRKAISKDLTPGEVERIIDDRIKKAVMDRIALHGNEKDAIKAALGDPDNPITIVNRYGKEVPVKRVRLYMKRGFEAMHAIDEGNGAYKYFPYGNNHHVEILECLREHRDADGKRWKVGDRRGVFVTTMEAARRARRAKMPIVQRDHGPDWRFVMSLAVNDCVAVVDDKKSGIYRVQLLAATNNKIVLRNANSADVDDNEQRLIKSPNTLQCTKLQVDPIGRTFSCND